MLMVPEKSSPTADPVELADPLMAPSAPRLKSPTYTTGSPLVGLTLPAWTWARAGVGPATTVVTSAAANRCRIMSLSFHARDPVLAWLEANRAGGFRSRNGWPGGLDGPGFGNRARSRVFPAERVASDGGRERDEGSGAPA